MDMAVGLVKATVADQACQARIFSRWRSVFGSHTSYRNDVRVFCSDATIYMTIYHQLIVLCRNINTSNADRI